MSGDRNLLFGAIAVQVGLINADQFAQACSTWSLGKAGSMATTLCEKGWLAPEDQAPIEHLVERRLAKCAGDLRATFAGYSAEIRSVLAGLCNHKTGGPAAVGQETIGYEGAGPAETSAELSATRYTLNRLHAAGGIGEIWLAHDADLERDVAVKRLQSRQSSSSVAMMRFVREARITGRLDHPGVVPIYEICFDDATGHPYYSMRFLKGKTLTDAVNEYHKQRQANGSDLQKLLELLSAFCIVCNTVAYAHSKGVIHRDLKCDNVILGDYGEVVVIDWGLAKELGRSEEIPAGDTEGGGLASAHPAATLAGHILGTPAYMAPEQAAGRLDLVGPSTDVYGLCAILYEILCGQPPFSGEDALKLLYKVQHDDPVPPGRIVPGVPESLEQICLKGLAKDPAQRHASADQLAKAVQGWVSDLAERRQAEEERERFFALSLDLLAIIDKSGRFRQVSPAWERLLGHERGRLVGTSFAGVIQPDDRPGTLDRLNSLAGSETAGTFEARVLGQDGTYRWVSWNVTPIAKEECLYAVGRDVTELKRSQQLFQGVLESAPDAMVLVNPAGQVVMVNRQTERLFGYREDELVGQSLEILVPERFREEHPAHVARFFASSSFRPMGAGLSLWGRRKDGQEIPVEISLSAITTETGQLVAASVREVTDRRLSSAAAPVQERSIAR